MTEDSLRPEEHEKHSPHARCEFTNPKTRRSFPPLTVVFPPANSAGSLSKTVGSVCPNKRHGLIPGGATGTTVRGGLVLTLHPQFSYQVKDSEKRVQEGCVKSITGSDFSPLDFSPLSGSSVGWLPEAAMLRSAAISHSTTSARGVGRLPNTEISVSVCLDCGTPIPARLVELAHLDLIMVTDRPMRYGTVVQLALFGDLVTTVTQNRGIVHWCRPHQHGWHVGVFLTMPLPDRLTEREWSDLRHTLRYECNWKAWVLWDGDGQLEPVWISDYSIKGVCLTSQRIVKQGSKFTMFGSTGTRDRAVLNGDVQWTRQNPDGVLIGCHIQGQRGRDLPKMFGNLDAVHVASEESPGPVLPSDSIETQNYELAAHERFLPADTAYARIPSTSFPCTSVNR